MTTATQQTAAANESRYASGISNDYCAAFEVAEWEAEQEAEAEDEDTVTMVERQTLNARMAEWWGC